MRPGVLGARGGAPRDPGPRRPSSTTAPGGPPPARARAGDALARASSAPVRDRVHPRRPPRAHGLLLPTTVITLAASLDLGGDELPVVDKTLEIRGACAPTACVLDAGAASRHLTVGVLGHLTLTDLFLTRGVAVGLLEATAAPSSSTARSSPAASSSPTNRAVVDGPSGGGAVAVHHGHALFEDCAFARNEASMDGGAVKVLVGTAEARDTAFDANVAGGVGAGVAVVSGAAYVRDCAFADDNDAREADSRDVHVDFGAAIYLHPYDGSYRAGGEGVIDRAPALPPPPGADPSAFPPPRRTRPRGPGGAESEGGAESGEGADSEGAVLEGVPIEGVAGAAAAAFAATAVAARVLSLRRAGARASESDEEKSRLAEEAKKSRRRGGGRQTTTRRRTWEGCPLGCPFGCPLGCPLGCRRPDGVRVGAG